MLAKRKLLNPPKPTHPSLFLKPTLLLIKCVNCIDKSIKKSLNHLKLTYVIYFMITSRKGSLPWLRNIDVFHSADLASMTEDAPVSCRNVSMSSNLIISFDPPLKLNK